MGNQGACPVTSKLYPIGLLCFSLIVIYFRVVGKGIVAGITRSIASMV